MRQTARAGGVMRACIARNSYEEPCFCSPSASLVIACSTPSPSSSAPASRAPGSDSGSPARILGSALDAGHGRVDFGNGALGRNAGAVGGSGGAPDPLESRGSAGGGAGQRPWVTMLGGAGGAGAGSSGKRRAAGGGPAGQLTGCGAAGGGGAGSGGAAGSRRAPRGPRATARWFNIRIVATSSSNEANASLGHRGSKLAVDGNMTTRWSSGYTDLEWLTLDLGSVKQSEPRDDLLGEGVRQGLHIRVSNDNRHGRPCGRCPRASEHGGSDVALATVATSDARVTRALTTYATRSGRCRPTGRTP